MQNKIQNDVVCALITSSFVRVHLWTEVTSFMCNWNEAVPGDNSVPDSSFRWTYSSKLKTVWTSFHRDTILFPSDPETHRIYSPACHCQRLTLHQVKCSLSFGFHVRSWMYSTRIGYSLMHSGERNCWRSRPVMVTSSYWHRIPHPWLGLGLPFGRFPIPN